METGHKILCILCGHGHGNKIVNNDYPGKKTGEPERKENGKKSRRNNSIKKNGSNSKGTTKPTDKNYMEESLRENVEFRRFCEEIESCRKNHVIMQSQRYLNSFTLETLINSLEYLENVTVCTQCLQVVIKVNAAKAKVEEREGTVLKMQLQLLKELKYLHAEMSLFHEELSRVEKLVTTSENQMSYYGFGMDVIKLEVEKEGFGEDARADSDTAKEKIHKASVMSFRSSILEAVNSLTSFNSQLASKLSYRPSSSPKPALEIEKRLPPKRKAKKLKIVRIVDLADETAEDDTNDHDDGIDIDDYHDADAEGELEMNNKDNLRGRLSSEKNKRKRKLTPTTSSPEEGGNNLEKDLPPQNKKPKRRARSRRRKAPIPIPESIDLQKMSEFRRRVIQRVYCRLEQQNKSVEEANNSVSNSSTVQATLDPSRNFAMEYNQTKDCLVVEGIEVTFNDLEETLLCSKCPFQAVDKKCSRSASIQMFYHILAKHLQVYQCIKCPHSLAFSSMEAWKDHMKTHERKCKFICDVCEKPLSTQQTLYNHRWSHMNLEEMTEAVKKGMKDPRVIFKKKEERKALRPFICATCGKGFSEKVWLRNHEQTHLKDRERIQCPKCGKSFVPKIFYYKHQKYVCRPDGSEPIPILKHDCQLCPPGKGKGIQNIQHHYERVHAPTAQNRPFPCDLCDLSFKSKGERDNHHNSHSENRPFVCSKGCGLAFKHLSNIRRHEGKCTGVCTPRMMRSFRKAKPATKIVHNKDKELGIRPEVDLEGEENEAD